MLSLLVQRGIFSLYLKQTQWTIDEKIRCEFGKTLGSDLEEGVYTLPVIHSLASGERDKVVRILHSRIHSKRFSMLREVLEKSGALSYAREKATVFVAQAKQELGIFPPSDFRASLEQLADHVLERNR